MLKKNKLKLKYLITIILIYFLYVLLCKKSKIIEGHNEIYNRNIPFVSREPHQMDIYCDRQICSETECPNDICEMEVTTESCSCPDWEEGEGEQGCLNLSNDKTPCTYTPSTNRCKCIDHDDTLEKPPAWPSRLWEIHSDQTRNQIIENFNKWGSAICRGRSSDGKIAGLSCQQILRSTEYNLESEDRSADRSRVANECNNACLTNEQIQAFQTIADTVLHYGGSWHSAVVALRSGASTARRPTNPPTPQAVIDLLENGNDAKAWTHYVHLFDENFDMAGLRRWYIEPAHWELGGEWVRRARAR